MCETWNGFARKEFMFERHKAILVMPEEGTGNGCLAVKTEYWDAFPEAAELELLKQGFYLCYIDNDNRWGTNADLDRKARFIRYVQTEYHLNSNCVPIGMSCGGLIAIKFAARYPGLVSCMYLDAPVVNYMSCPCGFGKGEQLSAEDPYTEILNALGLSSVSELLSYREMPLDQLPVLVANRIPVVLVAGDSDCIVPFEENGILIQKAYKEGGVELEVYIKPGGGHHPHGLKDSMPIISFILRHSEKREGISVCKNR